MCLFGFFIGLVWSFVSLWFLFVWLFSCACAWLVFVGLAWSFVSLWFLVCLGFVVGILFCLLGLVLVSWAMT